MNQEHLKALIEGRRRWLKSLKHEVCLKCGGLLENVPEQDIFRLSKPRDNYCWHKSCWELIPKICFFDNEPIEKLYGKDSDSLAIHHINGDHYDNRAENISLAHSGCHARYNRLQRPDLIKKFQEAGHNAVRGKPFSDEHKRRIRDSQKDKPRTHPLTCKCPFCMSKRVKPSPDKVKKWQEAGAESHRGKPLSKEHERKFQEGHRRWWNSLTPEEKSEIQRRRSMKQ